MADLGQHGLTLLAQFEAGPGGKPATEAYECSGGRYTLGLGATTWPDGSDVKPYDRCTMDQAIELTNWNVRRFADAVDRTIKVPISTNERDAMIMLAYNVGAEAFADCSVANRLNANPKNREYAAAAFAMWCKATNDVPDKPDLNEVFYQDVIGTNAKGKPCWVGPAVNPPKGWNVVRDGDEFWGVDPADASQIVPLGIKPVKYQKAMPGLLRRHLSEACLFLGLDWRQACRKDTVSITSRRVWDSVDRRWEDLVSKKTEVADVLAMARQHPLGADALANPAPLPAPAKPIPELELDTPAAPPQADAKAGTPEPATQPKAPAFPAPEQKPAASTSSGPSRDVAAPEAPKAAAPAKVPPAIIPVPPVVAGTDGAKPKSPNTTAPADVPYKIDPNAGLKPLEESERAKGYVVQQVGIGIIRLGSLGVFGTTIQGGAQVVQGDPVLSNIILMGFVAGGIAVVGYVVATYGAWKKKRGEQRASQGLF